MKRLLAIGLGTMVVAAGLARQGESAAQSKPAVSSGESGTAQAGSRPAPAEPAREEAGMRSIELPAVPVDLPPGPGRETVTGVCAFCHSNRYITLQPRFTRQQWTAEVDKMRKTYGAPLTDPQAAEAVNYLVSIRGADEPATKPAK